VIYQIYTQRHTHTETDIHTQTDTQTAGGTVRWVQESASVFSPLFDTFTPPLSTSDRRFTH